MTRKFLLFTAILLCSSVIASAQTSELPPSAAKTNVSEKPVAYSGEAFVLEKLRTCLRFENDGTGQREYTARFRVQSDAGVQALGQLVWGYNSANESLEIAYIRVRHSDGTTNTAGADAVQDLTSPVSRQAPMYSDYRQKHVTVPALRVGDTLEYRYTIAVHTPFAPGHFWAEHDFIKDAIVLDEELEVDVPRSRTLALKTAKGAEPVATEKADRRIYSWTTSNLKRDDEDGPTGKPKKLKSDEPEPPAIQLTTFSNWDEVGRWYASLEKERRVPNDAIRAKAASLIMGHAADLEKIEALYDFVSTKYRYVSLSFGIGRYQPHAASEVFTNEYGDCKDKNTLLAALLEAAGFHSRSVLINTSRKLDETLPSPGQFDHVITTVPVGGESVWLDTTTEIAPFRMLIAPLRDKQALVVPQDGAATLARTPMDPPFASFVRTEFVGEVNDVGKLTGHVKEQYRGDSELVIRSVLRSIPESRWKQIAEFGEARNGRTPEITAVKVANLADTREPLVMEYDQATSNYLDWSSKKVQLKLPSGNMQLTEPDVDDNINPLKLGAPGTAASTLRLQLPPRYRIRLPLPVTVKRDYAEYTSEYKSEGNTILVTRTMKLTKNELPPDRRADYRAFCRSLAQDQAQVVGLETNAGAPSLPESTKADDLEDAADAARDSRNYDAAITLYRRVVALEPRHKDAWNNMGRAQLDSGKTDDAIASFRKAIEVNPYEEWAYNNLGRALWFQEKYDEAAAAFKKQIEINPLDRYAHGNLGRMYMAQKNYSEALPELEKAAALSPDDSSLKFAIGQTYLNLGNDDKALAAFDELVNSMPVPLMWNNIAYELSKRNVHLDRAQRYAETAITTTLAMLRTVEAGDSERQQQMQDGLTSSLAAYWDTLGWIYFQRGDLAAAEPYIRAAWEIAERAEVGGHLAEIYEKRGEKDRAIDQYARALASGHANAELRQKLAALLGADANVNAAVDKRRALLSADRTYKVGKLVAEDANAEFALTFVSGPALESVHFLKGSEKLKPFTDVLKSKTYNVTLPGDTPVRLVRRGVLSCSKLVGECSFVLSPPERLLVSPGPNVVQMPVTPAGK